MNARFFAYALFYTQMMYCMEQSSADTKQLSNELRAMAALVEKGESCPKKDVEMLIEKLRAFRPDTKKRDKSRSPVLRSRGFGMMSSSIAANRMRG